MKLYSRSELVKSSLLALVAGVVLTLSGTAYFSHQHKDSEDNQGEETVSEETSKSGEGQKIAESETEDPAPVIAESHPVIEEKATSVAKSYDSGYTQDEQQNISVYEKCNEAVVNITTQVMGVNWFLEPVVQEGGSGSGSIIDKRGYVVTNVHVISNASKINISLHDGTSYEGTVIGKDVESDIAVIKFNPPDNVSLKTIDFGDSNNLKVGQKVIAIGNPFALERTMTTGIISGLGRPIQESTNVIIRNMIQTDAAINPGNSGGPLLDTNGKMVGINTVIISNSGSSAGVGFAVPVSTARRVVDDLIKYRKVNRGVLKIRPVQMTSSIARYAGVSINYGILVSEVEQGSSTEQSGILGGTQQVQYGSRFNPTMIYLGGDIITGIDNITIRTYADYTSALESKRPGDNVTVTVFRDGEFKKIKVKLDGKETSTRTAESQESAQSSML